ncbi:hypothetical protein Pan241w_07550 [Gimesia alba]|uniref:Uncharacterized protein n=1 Tax=Gimesia alba TaxID=2527973 RepID=A0A517R9X4_9PLAN|nr:hypothetical protein Pan241w_07550 [Gimesia alba]
MNFFYHEKHEIFQMKCRGWSMCQPAWRNSIRYHVLAKDPAKTFANHHTNHIETAGSPMHLPYDYLFDSLLRDYAWSLRPPVAYGNPELHSGPSNLFFFSCAFVFFVVVNNNRRSVLLALLVPFDHIADDVAEDGAPGFLDGFVPFPVEFLDRFDDRFQPDIIQGGLNIQMISVVRSGAFTEFFQ